MPISDKSNKEEDRYRQGTGKSLQEANQGNTAFVPKELIEGYSLDGFWEEFVKASWSGVTKKEFIDFAYSYYSQQTQKDRVTFQSLLALEQARTLLRSMEQNPGRAEVLDQVSLPTELMDAVYKCAALGDDSVFTPELAAEIRAGVAGGYSKELYAKIAQHLTQFTGDLDTGEDEEEEMVSGPGWEPFQPDRNAEESSSTFTVPVAGSGMSDADGSNELTDLAVKLSQDEVIFTDSYMEMMETADGYGQECAPGYFDQWDIRLMPPDESVELEILPNAQLDQVLGLSRQSIVTATSGPLIRPARAGRLAMGKTDVFGRIEPVHMAPMVVAFGLDVSSSMEQFWTRSLQIMGSVAHAFQRAGAYCLVFAIDGQEHQSNIYLMKDLEDVFEPSRFWIGSAGGRSPLDQALEYSLFKVDELVERRQLEAAQRFMFLFSDERPSDLSNWDSNVQQMEKQGMTFTSVQCVDRPKPVIIPRRVKLDTAEETLENIVEIVAAA